MRYFTSIFLRNPDLASLIMPPTSKKLTGHIGLGLSVHACVCLSHFLMHAISYE